MIKYILLFCFLCCIVCKGEIVTNSYYDFNNKTTYRIEFNYTPNKFTVLNKIKHYPSSIAVYRLQNSEYILLDTFSGFYTAHQCWEDSIIDIIRKTEYINYSLPYPH